MKDGEQYIALLEDGEVAVVWRTKNNIYYDYDQLKRCYRKIEALFNAEEAMQFLIDCEWEGKIKQSSVEFEEG